MYTTLNISAKSISLLSVRRSQVEKWGSIPLASGLIKDGLILQPEAVGAAISDLLKSTEVTKGQVIASLTGLPFTYRVLSLPRMKANLLDEAIRRGARKEMPLPLEELYLSWQAIGSRDDELDFFVLGVPKKSVDAVLETFEEAGVKSCLMDVKPLALARAANRKDAIIADLEPDGFEIVLVANGIPTIMHAMTPKSKGATLEDNIRRLTDELSKTVKFYNSNHPENPLGPTMPLLLTGELSADTALGDLIRAETGYPVEPLVPPLKLPPDLPVASYVTNIGLALKKGLYKTFSEGDTVNFKDINLNILAGAYRPKIDPTLVRRMLLIIALVIGISVLLPLYQLKSQAYAETMRLQTELTGVNQKLREAKQIENTINEIAGDAETIRQEHQYILSKAGDFATNLRLVTNAFASGTYFTSVEIGADEITLEGVADNSFKVIGYTMALETIGKFSEVRIARIDDGYSTGAKSTKVSSAGVSFTIVIRK